MDDVRFRELVLSGVKLQEIADEFGFTVSGVLYHVRRLGLPRRNKKKRHFQEGEVIGSWTLLKRIVRDKQGYWHCRCACGHEGYLQTGNLGAGSTRRCRGCSNRWVKEAAVIPKRCWDSIRHSAAARGHDFAITREDAEKLIIQQNYTCAKSGTTIWFAANWLEHKKPDGTTASLDRIDSSLGYVPGNIQWVHKDVNKMKQSFTDAQFVELCRKVADWSRATVGPVSSSEIWQAA